MAVSTGTVGQPSSPSMAAKAAVNRTSISRLKVPWIGKVPSSMTLCLAFQRTCGAVSLLMKVRPLSTLPMGWISR